MSHPLGKHGVHACRVGLLVCIAVLMRLQQQAILSATPANEVPELGEVNELYPRARALQPARDGRVTVLDENDSELGYVIQTSPISDHIIGFSGSTNVLIGFSAQDTVVGLRIQSSGDTREHVRQVSEDELFLSSLNGLSTEQAKAHAFDAVSGATLTSLAIGQSVALRLGSTATASLRFPDPPSLEVVQTLVPAARRVEQVSGSRYRVFDQDDDEVGSVLRTSPAADNTIGYQGPTDALVGLDLGGKVVGVAVGKSYDNEPYVGYVREDDYFRSTFNKLDLRTLAEFDLLENQVEGVSGATMTSMAVADGIVLAAQDAVKQLKANSDASTARKPHFFSLWTPHDWGTALCVMLGAVIGLTKLRANRTLALVWKGVLIGYLGIVAGSLLSQAMFVGWAARGVPTTSSFGLVVLALAALCVPIATRRNLYCSHLCPHGAAQQLLKNRLRTRWRMSARWRTCLRFIPALLLLWCLIVAMGGLTFSLVDIEPFDAWVFRIAGWATITIAIVGLVASMFVPMAYCRYGCPTGALLEFLRFNAKANQWSMRDWVATGYFVLAVCIYLAS